MADNISTASLDAQFTIGHVTRLRRDSRYMSGLVTPGALHAGRGKGRRVHVGTGRERQRTYSAARRAARTRHPHAHCACARLQQARAHLLSLAMAAGSVRITSCPGGPPPSLERPGTSASRPKNTRTTQNTCKRRGSGPTPFRPNTSAHAFPKGHDSSPPVELGNGRGVCQDDQRFPQQPQLHQRPALPHPLGQLGVGGCVGGWAGGWVGAWVGGGRVGLWKGRGAWMPLTGPLERPLRSNPHRFRRRCTCGI